MQRRRTLVGMPVPVLCRPAVAARAGWGIAGMFAHDCGSGASPGFFPGSTGWLKRHRVVNTLNCHP
jgi:hypothetical protein